MNRMQQGSVVQRYISGNTRMARTVELNPEAAPHLFTWSGCTSLGEQGRLGSFIRAPTYSRGSLNTSIFKT
jgi:hypothetical protein